MIVIQRTCHICIDFSPRRRSIKFPKPLLNMPNMHLVYWRCCKWNLRAVMFLLKTSLCLLHYGTTARLYKLFSRSCQDENKLVPQGRWKNWNSIIWLLRDQHMQPEVKISIYSPRLRERRRHHDSFCILSLGQGDSCPAHEGGEATDAPWVVFNSYHNTGCSSPNFQVTYGDSSRQNMERRNSRNSTSTGLWWVRWKEVLSRPGARGLTGFWKPSVKDTLPFPG